MKEQYFPSNGTEGEQFFSAWCERCYKYNQCTILDGSLLKSKEPKQWIYDNNGKPTCTSFKSRAERAKEIKLKPKRDNGKETQRRLF